MKVVLDTNVLVSGLLQPLGPSGQILKALAVGDFDLYLDARILAEYVAVLARKKFNFSDEAVPTLMHTVETDGHLVAAPSLDLGLDDPKDRMFCEVAHACQADYLVTGNLKHFPPDKAQGIPAISPRQYLDLTTPRPSPPAPSRILHSGH